MRRFLLVLSCAALTGCAGQYQKTSNHQNSHLMQEYIDCLADKANELHARPESADNLATIVMSHCEPLYIKFRSEAIKYEGPGHERHPFWNLYPNYYKKSASDLIEIRRGKMTAAESIRARKELQYRLWPRIH